MDVLRAKVSGRDKKEGEWSNRKDSSVGFGLTRNSKHARKFAVVIFEEWFTHLLLGNFDRMITPLKMKNASIPEGLSSPSTSVKELRFHFDEIPLCEFSATFRCVTLEMNCFVLIIF